MAEEKTAFVRDVLAMEGKARRHTLIESFMPDGKTVRTTRHYDLKAEVGTEMPLAHAMQFLKDANFVVSDAAGNIIQPIPVVSGNDRGGQRLQPGETVAHLSELTTSALLKRCKASAFSGNINEESSRETMIEYLMSEPARNAGPAQSADVAATFAAAGGQMAPKEIASIFGD